MADIEQWVNLTRNNKWIGDGLTSRARMGRIAPLNIQFDQHHRATVWITKEADGGNAVYSATELPQRTVFRAPVFVRRRISTDRRGRLNLDVPLTAAGGDKFTIRVEDRAGNELRSDTFNVRRKLYFQVIKMAGVAAVSAGDVAGMQSEFWNTAENVYIKMVEHHAGRTIAARRNINHRDQTAMRRLRNRARRVYSRTKNPYSFSVIVVQRNSRPQEESVAIAGVSFPAPAPNPAVATSFTFNTQRILFDIVDPAESYYINLEWMPTIGSPVQIPVSRLTRNGQNQITIDTTGYPSGLGVLSYSMRVVGNNGRGVSQGGENLVIVASQDAITGAAVPPNEIMAVLVHEIGHKIGMVPNAGGVSGLDRQNTQYDGHGHVGNHCYHGLTPPTAASPLPASLITTGGLTPDCTMFGDTRSATSRFCSDCKTSLRKLDLRSRTNIGIRTQF